MSSVQVIGLCEEQAAFCFWLPSVQPYQATAFLNLLQECCTFADFITLDEANACGGFLRECFA